jgi:uncharacterized spore protein YtfJ
VIELETSRTTESRASFVVGDRTFHVVTEVVEVKSPTGKVFSVFVSPIALLVLEPHSSYVVSLTDEEFAIEDLLSRVPELKGKILSLRDR